MDIIIYGAQMVAVSVYYAIKELYHIEATLFCVSSEEGNPSVIDGKPVVTLENLQMTDVSGVWRKRQEIPVLIATPQVHHDMIQRGLERAGFRKMIEIDSVAENCLLREYYEHVGFQVIPEQEACRFCQKSDGENSQVLSSELSVREDAKKKLQIYMAKSHVDKALQHLNQQKSKLPGYEYLIPIQVGCGLTDIRLSDVGRFDDIGVNISDKNRNYCELTGAYWAWKHADSDYVGLCHYRRLFDLTETQIQWMLQEKVDAVLLFPSIQYPNALNHHRRYISENDWNAMRQSIKELEPEYDAAFDEIFSEQYFYHYNMLIARREVFAEYSEFLFKILARTEELTEPAGWEREDRFAGYMGENLLTLFFRKNRERFHIVHTGKIWLV